MPHEDRPPQLDRMRAEDRDPGWAIPFAFGGIALLIGALFFYNHGGGSPTLTAVNTTPQMQQTAPPAAPVAPKQ